MKVLSTTFISSLLLVLFFNGTVLGQPQILVDPLEIEPDLIPQLEVEMIISISNVGDEQLSFDVNIVYIEGDEDDYLTVVPDSGIVEPDRDLDLILSYSRDQLGPGHSRAEIRINSNDPDAEIVIVRFHELMPFLPVIISLSEGWNLISSYLIPNEYRDIRMVLGELVERESILLVKDGRGRFYVPARNFNNIPFWNFRDGYYVKMAEADTRVIYGDEVAFDTPIPLRQNWNTIAYFPEDEIEAPEAFENIEEILILAKDGRGRFYYPEIGFNNMRPLRRGQGYKVKVEQDGELIWNVP